MAGELSGDLHGAALARELRALDPACRLLGVGGQRMAEAGVELVVRMEELAVLGFAEVARRLPQLRRAMRGLQETLGRERPDVFVPIDYPGMNLRLAASAWRGGIPVVYFVGPQVWAWGAWRLKAIRRTVRRMLVILPFEEEYYRRHGIDARFVGHPLVDAVAPREPRAEFRRRRGIEQEAPLVALLPGSRAQEAARMFPPMLGAVRRLSAEIPALRCVAAAATPERAAELSAMAAAERAAAGGDGAPVRVVEAETYEALAAADLALVASGTATVECACLGVPMVVIYRVAPLSWWIARALVRVPHVAMANLIAGERLVPELLQGEANPARIAAEARSLLTDAARRERVRAGLDGVRRRLGEPGAARRAAEQVLAVAAGAAD